MKPNDEFRKELKEGMKPPTEFDKELAKSSQIFFDNSTGGAYTVTIKETREYLEFEKAIKQAVEKHLLIHMTNWSDLDSDTIETYDDAFEKGGFVQIEKQRKALFGDKS